MDIERELEILINKHKGKQVGLGEIRLDWFAEDCLKEIRRLKTEIALQTATSEEVQRAISWAQDMEVLYEEQQMPSCADCAKLAVTALQAYQPWIPVSDRLPEEYRFVLISIFNGKATGVGMIDKKKRWHGIDHQEMELMPEAWKSLPEPPKGE